MIIELGRKMRVELQNKLSEVFDIVQDTSRLESDIEEIEGEIQLMEKEIVRLNQRVRELSEEKLDLLNTKSTFEKEEEVAIRELKKILDNI